MIKITLGIVLVVLIAEATCQRFIQPTFRPPRQRKPVIRYARDVSEPLWLYLGDIARAPATGDHPVLPKYIDDIRIDPNSRYARSVDSPSAKRGGGSPGASRGSGSSNTGPTHPGYNRRNARDVYQTFPRPSTFPRPRPGIPRPGPTFPQPKPKFPIYARNTRDVNFGRKPSHRDVIIPNWNPNARTNPWNRLAGKRRTRSAEISEEEQLH